jgi:hypothetical protein
MLGVNEKALAKAIKAQKKGRLMWQKADRFKAELVSNGDWTVVVPEIKELSVKVALYSVFGKEIEPGESIRLLGEQITEGENYLEVLKYEPEYANSAATLTPIVINSTVDNSAARIVHIDSETLGGVPLEYADLVEDTLVYTTNGNAYAPYYFGEQKAVMIRPTFPRNDKTWQDIIRKYAGRYATM